VGIVASFLHFRLLESTIEKWQPDNGFLIHTLKNQIVHDIDASLRILVATSRQPAFSSLPFLDQVDPSLNGIPKDADVEKRNILETLRADYGGFSVLFVLSPNGDHYISHPYSVQQKLGKFNLADRSYFIEATLSKKPVVSDSFTGADGIPAVAIDVPILNPENEIVAHLGGVFHLSKLSKLVDANVIRPFDSGFIVDRQGKLIAHTDTRLMQDGKREEFATHPLVINQAENGAENRSGPTGEFADPDDGTEFLVASSRLENGWLLVLLRKKQEIVDDVHAQVAAVSLLVFLMLFGIGTVSALMIARITRKWEAAEHDLRQTRDELEERVVARTRELESSERRFRRLFENSEVSIWNEDKSEVRAALNRLRGQGVNDLRQYLNDHIELAGELAALVKVVHVNEATMRLFGADSENEFLCQIDKTFGGNSLEVFKNELCAIWDEHKTFRSGAKFHTLDGKNIDAIISFQIPETEEGFSSIPVSIFDISNIKAAEADLKQSQERFQDFANVAADWFWEQDTDFRFTYITEENAAVTGQKRGDHYGKTRQEIGFLDIIPEDLAAHEETLKARRPFNDFQFARMRPDGQKVYISVSGKPTFDLDGAFTGYRGAGREITKMVEAERTIRAERDRAEAANRAKSEFLASMSHELRTPLNAVLGFAQMLKIDPRTTLTRNQKEHLDSILTGGNHLLDLVNEILDLAKIEADQLDLSLEDVNAYEIAVECMDLTRPLGDARGIEIIDQTTAGPWPYLRTDRMRLKQVLLNLLSNAIKFNKDGGSVTLEGPEAAGGFLRISVTDSGIGIAEKDHANVFMMFQRLGADPMKAREGTGIGLTVAKHLVEKMAGRIGFQSKEGVGSTFWLELPLVSNDETLIWTEEMRIGVDALDKDHQVLISMLNQISNGAADDAGVGRIVDNLISYTLYHFRREEAVMDVCGCPTLDQHRELHRNLAVDICGLADTWRQDPNPVSLGYFRQFLRTWLSGHVMAEDAENLGVVNGNDQDIRRALREVDELDEVVSNQIPETDGADLTVRMKSSGEV